MIPAFLAPLATGLGAVVLQMLVKTIGYDFISTGAVILADAWADTTETDKDNMVVEAWGKRLGVPDDVLEKIKNELKPAA